MQELIAKLYECSRDTLATEIEALLAIYGDEALSEFKEEGHDKEHEEEETIRIVAHVKYVCIIYI